MSGRVRGFFASKRLLLIAPLLLFGTLLAWSLSSPVGSSPDEDYHLVSIWCATGDAASCVHETGSSEAKVPGALVRASCFAFDSDESAACQDPLDFTGPVDTTTDRGNFYGAYPPVFHHVMSIFVGDDIRASVVMMRAFISLVFTVIATALFLLLPPARRPTLVWSWVVTTVPLGLFVLTSLNPSAWAVAGVGFGWLALAGFFESSGRRKIGLGVIFALSVVMAAGSRGDAGLYMALAIGAAAVLQARRTKRFALDAILPAVALVFCFLMFRVSRPTEALTQGVPPDNSLSVLLGRVLPTMFDVPALWMGVFGKGWGLGWLDTSMPAIVWIATLGVFLGTGIVAGIRGDRRKYLVLGGGFAVLLLLPTAVLVAAGQPVGENLQPRYLLPLIVLFAGVLFWAPPGRVIRFGRAQRIVVVAALAGAQSIALFIQLARYVSGFDNLGPNLDGAIEWWWDIAISPMTVWALGSLAYAGLLTLLIGRASSVPPIAPPLAIETPPARAGAR